MTEDSEVWFLLSSLLNLEDSGFKEKPLRLSSDLNLVRRPIDFVYHDPSGMLTIISC